MVTFCVIFLTQKVTTVKAELVINAPNFGFKCSKLKDKFGDPHFKLSSFTENVRI